MIIIFDGCDKTGKTTLINKIKKILNFETLYIGKEFKNCNVDMYLKIIDEIKNKNILLDRFFYSEFVYGKICRNGSLLNENDFKKIEDKLILNKSKFILCTNSFDSINNFFIKDKEDYIKSIYINKILNEFEDIFIKSNLEKKRFKINDNIKQIINFIERNNE